MSANRKPTTKNATEDDFFTGSILIDQEHNTEIVIQDKYDEGMYNARVFDGYRVVGDKVIFTCEARFYQVKI